MVFKLAKLNWTSKIKQNVLKSKLISFKIKQKDLKINFRTFEKAKL
jgi:hypothetical protein